MDQSQGDGQELPRREMHATHYDLGNGMRGVVLTIPDDPKAPELLVCAVSNDCYLRHEAVRVAAANLAAECARALLREATGKEPDMRVKVVGADAGAAPGVH